MSSSYIECAYSRFTLNTTSTARHSIYYIYVQIVDIIQNYILLVHPMYFEDSKNATTVLLLIQCSLKSFELLGYNIGSW
jgi:hypothetical protein